MLHLDMCSIEMLLSLLLHELLSMDLKSHLIYLISRNVEDICNNLRNHKVNRFMSQNKRRGLAISE